MKKLEQMPQRVPVNGTFELTLRCNLQCKMCLFRPCASRQNIMAKEELSAQQWISLAQQAAQAGTLDILITGGEPMLRRDFAEIYRGIYAQGFVITLYTNATLVTPQIMQTLRDCPPHRIGVTLYGASNETYEKVCGCKDGFDRAMEGVRQLATLPSVLDFRMTLIRESIEDMQKLEQLIGDEFGAAITQSKTVLKSVRGGCSCPESCRLDARENVDRIYERRLHKLRQELPQSLWEHVQLKLEQRESLCKEEKNRYSVLGCSGGMDSYTLTWDGKLLGCQLLDAFYTDAVGEGFQQAWDRYPYTVRLPQQNPTCASCALLSRCEICPAVCAVASS